MTDLEYAQYQSDQNANTQAYQQKQQDIENLQRAANCSRDYRFC